MMCWRSVVLQLQREEPNQADGGTPLSKAWYKFEQFIQQFFCVNAAILVVFGFLCIWLIVSVSHTVWVFYLVFFNKSKQLWYKARLISKSVLCFGFIYLFIYLVTQHYLILLLWVFKFSPKTQNEFPHSASLVGTVSLGKASTLHLRYPVLK